MPSKVAKENSTTLCLQYPPCLMDAEEHQLCPVCAKWNRKTYRRTLESALVYTYPFYKYFSLLVYFYIQ